MKHAKVVCQDCAKTVLQGKRPFNKTIINTVCGECRKAKERRKQNP